MPRSILVDTDILIDFLRGREQAVSNAGLKTLNVKHYPMFDAIEPAYLK